MARWWCDSLQMVDLSIYIKRQPLQRGEITLTHQDTEYTAKYELETIRKNNFIYIFSYF